MNERPSYRIDLERVERAIRQYNGIGLLLATNRLLARTLTEYVDEYERWIWFYSDLIRSLDGGERDALLAADNESQPAGTVLPGTLLRVLDKAFYMWHDESVAEAP